MLLNVTISDIVSATSYEELAAFCNAAFEELNFVNSFGLTPEQILLAKEGKFTLLTKDIHDKNPSFSLLRCARIAQANISFEQK